MSRSCDICGRIQDETHKIKFNKKANCLLCEKHRRQFYRYGKFLDDIQKTTNDKNDYNIKQEYAELIIRDNKQNIKAIAIIDIDDVEKCKLKKWYIDTKGYPTTTNKLKLHRYILSYNGQQQVDHINRNKLDNRKSNLRIVDCFINNQNNGKDGVSYDKNTKKWKTEFQRYGKYFNAGVYNTKEEAIQARIIAINKIEKHKDKLLSLYQEKDYNHSVGVRPSPHGRWVAKFCADGKTYHVGTFDTQEEAIIKRQEAINKHKNLKVSA